MQLIKYESNAQGQMLNVDHVDVAFFLSSLRKKSNMHIVGLYLVA